MGRLCVIFDLDGTLVDSEPLCNQAFLDLLPDLKDSLRSLVCRYRGRRLIFILNDLSIRLGRPLPEDFERKYRERVADLMIHNLRPTSGAREMLEALSYPRCIASSGPREKIRQALQITGLAAHFGANIFSSYDIKAWKPDPGLFLYAASAMGFGPEECVVIEDSTVGIAAAGAAGMRSILFAPDEAAGDGTVVNSFHRMAELPRLLHRLSTAFA
jgi:HAD superfamily hydrolase (TIGR01509 family)